MTPSRLRECLTALDWDNRGLARLTGWSEGAVRLWLAGERPVPRDVGAWLEKLARVHERNPPPKRESR